MLNSAKVSIIIPVYNVGKYLAPCLNSLCNQTLLDIEILCINNNSTDNSLEILQEFAEADSRIIILDEKKKGPGAARNSGLNHAAGEIVMFCDSDDCLVPDACEKIWCEFQERPTDAVVFNASLFPEIGEIPSWLPWHLSLKTREYEGFSPQIIFKTPGALPFVWRNAFRNELLKSCGVKFAEDLMLAEDALFLLQVYPHAKQRISLISDNLYQYRWVRNGSLMNLSNQDQDLRNSIHLEVVRRALNYYKDNAFSELWGTDILEWILNFIIPDIRPSRVTLKKRHLEELTMILCETNLISLLPKIHGSAKYAARYLVL